MNKNFRERFINKPGKFLKISGREKLLFFEALALHMVVGLLLKLMSFKRIVRIFSSRQLPAGNQQSKSILEVRDAVRRAGRVSPWKNGCLVSSLTARVMLNRKGIRSELTMGVTNEDNGKLIAHAWLKAEGYEIVEMGRNYTGLYNF